MLVSQGGCGDQADTLTSRPPEVVASPDVAPLVASAGSTRLSIRARFGGEGIAGVRITLRAVDSPDGIDHHILWQGVTDDAGRAIGFVSLRADQREVEVIAHREGYGGTYDDPSLRAAHGTFAPSAWLRASVASLASLDVALEHRDSSASLMPEMSPAPGVAPMERAFVDGWTDVPAAVNADLGARLPERVPVAASAVSRDADPNVTLTVASTLQVTFLREGSTRRSALGYFTFRGEGTSATLGDARLIFPNASHRDTTLGFGGGALVTGDTVTLRDVTGAARVFLPGERVGFFVAVDAWDGTAVRGWANPTVAMPSAMPDVNEGFSRGVFTSLDALNPELVAGRADVARHFAVVRSAGTAGMFGGRPWLALGFEEDRRDELADDDFNDLVVLVSSAPAP